MRILISRAMRWLVVVCVIALSSCQNPVLFPSSLARNRLSVKDAAALRPPPVRVSLAKSFGWFFQAETSPHAIMMFHGNAETVDDYAQWAASIAQRGVSVLLVEFPGYRGAGGKATQLSIRKVALAGYDRLRSSGYSADGITVFGRSVGAAAACDLSRHREVKRLLLVSPFTTLGEVARHAGLPEAVALGKFNNREALADYGGRLLIVHGRLDAIIPFSMGQELIGASGTPDQNRFFLALDAGHNDLLSRYEGILTERIVSFAVGSNP
jgi:pimeloyl-ACP methyl ester carboxylesterase